MQLPGPQRTGFARQRCLGFCSSSAWGNQASSFHSSRWQDFSIFLDLEAQGKIRPRAMKEAILINSNTHQERGLFQWLSETLKKENNKIHLHVNGSSEKSWVCSCEKFNAIKPTLTSGFCATCMWQKAFTDVLFAGLATLGAHCFTSPSCFKAKEKKFLFI